MRLTKKKAIEIAIELWTWLAETGSISKLLWPGWEKYGEMGLACPLCEYDARKAAKSELGACNYCPYCEVFGECMTDEFVDATPYDMWVCATATPERKKYASQFLEQLKQL